MQDDFKSAGGPEKTFKDSVLLGSRRKNIILGVVSILLATTIAITLLFLCKYSGLIKFITYGLFFIGLFFLSPELLGRASLEIKVKPFTYIGTGLTAILIFVAMEVDPLDNLTIAGCTSKTSVTVFVYGQHGSQDMVLRNQGHVFLNIGNEPN